MTSTDDFDTLNSTDDFDLDDVEDEDEDDSSGWCCVGEMGVGMVNRCHRLADLVQAQDPELRLDVLPAHLGVVQDAGRRPIRRSRSAFTPAKCANDAAKRR